MAKYNPLDRSIATNRLFPSEGMLPPNGTMPERLPPVHERHRCDLGRQTFRSIMVPVDGAVHAEHALPYALAIARRSGATVKVVHVQSSEDHARPWAKRARHKYLSSLAAGIARNNAVSIETMLIESNYTEDALLRASSDADLLVVASRRRGAFRRLCSYCIPDALRTRLQTPMLLIRGDSSRVDLSWDPIARHVLIPLDGSASAESILEPATALGRLTGAMLTLTNVQNGEWASGRFKNTTPSDYLDALAREARRSICVVGTHVVSTDRAIATVLASYPEVDLIALTTRATRGFSDLWRRGIVDLLIRRTNLPILLLRSDIGSRNEHESARLGTVPVPSSSFGRMTVPAMAAQSSGLSSRRGSTDCHTRTNRPSRAGISHRSPPLTLR